MEEVVLNVLTKNDLNKNNNMDNSAFQSINATIKEHLDNEQCESNKENMEKNSFNIVNSAEECNILNSDDLSSKNDSLQSYENNLVKHMNTNVQCSGENNVVSDIKVGSDTDEIINTSKSKKRIILFDSDEENSKESVDSNPRNKNSSETNDSSNEGVENSSETNIEGGDKINNMGKSNKNRSLLKLIDSDDSDSESIKNTAHEDIENGIISINNRDKCVQNSKSRLKIIDSDTSDEEEELNRKLINKNHKKEVSETVEFDSDKRARLSALCDAESSEDENQEYLKSNLDEVDEDAIMLPKSRKRNVEKSEKPKKMTGKEAMEQRREIISESQRMLRESHVALPYHRAKSHSLKEFMSRRQRVSDVFKSTVKVPNHLNIKMNIKQLELAAQRLQEREKNLEEFYKSEDESENEEEIKNESQNEKKVNNTEQEKEEKIEEVGEEKKDSEENIEKELNLCENTEINNQNSEIETQEISMEIDENLKDKNVEPIDTDEDAQEKMEIGVDHVSGDTMEQTDNINKISDVRVNLSEEFENMEAEETKISLGNNNELKENEEKLPEENLQQNLETINSEGNGSNEVEEICESKSEENLKQETETVKPDTNKFLEKLKKLNPLLSKTDFKPRITGNTEEIIILDEDVDRTKGIEDLKKRFLTHNKMKPFHTKDEKDIEGIDTNVLKHESAKILIDHDDVDRVIEQKPGLKLKKLREELSSQMARKRLEQWEKAHKEIEEQKQTGENEGVKENCEMEMDDEEEEEEMTDTESSSDEEEEDTVIKDKPRIKSTFVDDEAEESDEEYDDLDGQNVSSEEENEENEENQSEEDTKKEKVLKRIINKFSDESDSETEDKKDSNIEQQSEDKNERVKFSTGRTSNEFDFDNDAENPELKKSLKEIINAFSDDSNEVDALKHPNSKSNQSYLDDTQSMPTDDEDIPLYQHENLDKTPSRITQTKSDFNFTPMSCLTSVSKPTITISPGIVLTSEPSPLRRNPGLKTKLFETNETTDLTQAFEELEGLCSGKFAMPGDKLIEENSQSTSQEYDLSRISQNLEMTPRGFTQEFDISQGVENKLQKDEAQKENEEANKIDEEVKSLNFDYDWENSQDMKLTLDEDVTKSEKFAEKKEGKLVIASSDEEDENPIFSERKKRKKKKLGFSDDEMSSDDDDDDLEEVNEDAERDEPQEVHYDSEENEIEFDENEEIIQEKVKKTFFEAEAELSESEWGSEDEDERDLDNLEMEDGDAEQFNEKKLQKELGRIHMRQVMDQDSREVKLLQEMLLEDGELHGASRERKFRWKNADSMTWNDSEQPKDDDDDAEEIETELHWRKMRHERETFLEEQRKKALEASDELDLLASDSQLMKIGQEVLKKSQDISTSQQPVAVISNEDSSTFTLFNHKSYRGSFLARSEISLSRLVDMTKTSSKEVVVGSGPKNSRNFLFTSVNKTDEECGEEGVSDKKRKATEGTPKVLKKMRISEGSLSGKKSKKSLKSVLNQL